MTITLCIRPDDARNQLLAARRKGLKIGVVPTMGALHHGHLSLVKACCSDCDFSVVTIFVNPTQFAPGEDFERYPRDLDKDLELLRGLGVDLVFAPNTNDIYRPEHSTYVQPPKVAELWEGRHRPEHFRGVTTVVLKLLQIIPADVAFFGQKDYQQVRVIKDMCLDLDLPVSIQVCPTIREADGLARSSRNAYLSAEDRQRALKLSQALKVAVNLSRTEASATKLTAEMEQVLESGPVDEIDYVAIVDPTTLQPVERITAGCMALIAAYVGGTRLIDNARLG